MKYFSPLILVFILGCNTQTKAPTQVKPLYNYDVEQKISDLGIELKVREYPPGVKIAKAKRSGNLLFLSGSGSIHPNGERITGKVGTDLTVEEGYDAARLVAINHLADIQKEIGDLNKVVNIVKVLGMVNTDSSFTQHPAVINGYTELMVDVFGERGKHARSAVGMGSLPFNLACEIETIVEVRD